MLTLSVFLPVLKIFTYVVGIILLLFVFRLLKLIRYQRLLRDVDIAQTADFVWPKVSLIVPVCNEASTVEKAAKSLFSMDYPNIEFIFVNDRSTDNTIEILTRLAANESRMKIITVRELQKGWLGKVHAFEQGRLASDGEWVLFSDADVHYHAQSLKKAMTYALKDKIDFLGVFPSVVGGTFLVRLLVAQFIHCLTLAVDFTKISNPKYSDAVAHGAFMLMHRAAYQKSKGFEWLKMEVMDDIGLAVEMKRSGAKIAILSGLDEIEFEWYPTAKALIRGYEKNGFAAMQYSPLLVCLMFLAFHLIFLGYTIIPPLTGDIFCMSFVWFSLGIYLLATAYSIRTMIHLPAWSVCLFPLTLLISVYIIIHAAIKCLKQKGIYWRDTFYPLSELKKKQRVRIIKILPQ